MPFMRMLLRTAIRAGYGALLLASAALAIAQTEPVRPATELATGLDEVIVTGSRIPRSNLVSANPVTQIDQDELLYSGATRLEDLVKSLPQLYAPQSSGVSNGSSGTATLDLRALGAQRTLVLVDGRRLPQGSPFTAGAADINQIPGAMLERVEVLTGGASAIYGSDAVAGVVNFIMRRDFEGVQLDYQFSRYTHDNNNGSMSELLEQRRYDVPEGRISDGDAQDGSLLIGGNFADGRGNLTAYATWRDIESVIQADRVYSACSITGPVDGYTCGGSSTTEKASLSNFGGISFLDPDDPDYAADSTPLNVRVEGSNFASNSPSYRYNFAPLNYFQRPDERYTGGVIGHYEVNEKAEFYTQIMFMDDRTVAQIAPTGAFGIDLLLSCDNPLLSEQQRQTLCTDRGLDEVASVFLSRRNVEGGPRRNDLRHTSWRGVFGLRGDIDPSWSYDASAQRSEVSMEQTFYNDMLLSRIRRALDVVTDPASGQPACAATVAGSDPNCLPWNVFGTGPVTQGALNYMGVPLFARGTTEQSVYSSHVTGDLANWGLASPFAESAVQMVFGAEYREEQLDYNPDDNFRSGDSAGGGGASFDGGGFDVSELFGELAVPLVEGRPFVQSLGLELGYRYSDYSTGVDTDTWGSALSWELNDQIRLRASVARAVRVPNIDELYSPQFESATESITSDPCAGAAPALSFEDCARTGVTAAQYGTIPDTPYEGLQTLEGGNADLEPEEADTLSAGVVLSPEIVDGLTLSLDWYEIQIDQAISTVLASTYFDRCVETGDPEFCSRINRSTRGGPQGLGGLLWEFDGYINTTNQNIGVFQTSGIDTVLDWSLDVGLGELAVHGVANYTQEYEQQSVPGEPVLACEGRWGSTCGYPAPEWRHQLRLTWTTPWNLTLSAAWRHIGEVEADDPLLDDIDAQDYFDLSGLWDIDERLRLRVGVNNVLDEEPPIMNIAPVSTGSGNGNTFPGLYDALGMYWFTGLSAQF